MSSEATLSVRRLLSEATESLRAAGIAQPRREARLILQDMMDWTATEFISSEARQLDADRVGEFRHRVDKRARRIPLAHINGRVTFFGLDFFSDSRALIPRTDSEAVVEEALARLNGRVKAPQVVDLGTGTGCLLLSILANRPRAAGIGMDISVNALMLARANAADLGLGPRARFMHGDYAKADLSEADLVVSNPPYIASGLIPALDPEVRDHDPHLALDGGSDGLDAYRTLIPLARASMKPGAWLVLEIGYDQAEAVTILAEMGGFREVWTRKDYGGRDRVLSMRQT